MTTRFLFFDDTDQRRCTRPGMNRMIGVGGAVVTAASLRPLAQAIDALCTDEYRFPAGEAFKWSPNKNMWMRENLIEDRRTQFFCDVLDLAKEHEAVFLAVMAEKGKRFATDAANHEQDCVNMLLERYHGMLGYGELGIAIASRPSGGRGDEDRFLGACETVRQEGTVYAKFEKLALNVVTMQANESRLLQLADLVASITGAMIAGNETFAKPIWPKVSRLFREDYGRKGGVGMKIHPDFSYANLYHWLLGDDFYKRGSIGVPMPLEGRPFYQSIDVR